MCIRDSLTLLYKNAVAVVDLVLDDLRRPAGKILYVGLHGAVLPLHFDGAVALGLALPLQGQAAFLSQVQSLAVELSLIHISRQRGSPGGGPRCFCERGFV